MWTFTGGRENTVIDYVIGDEDTRDKMERVEVGESSLGPSPGGGLGEERGGGVEK